MAITSASQAEDTGSIPVARSTPPLLRISDGQNALIAAPGELILLSGPCGSGKSLLLRRLAALAPLPAGWQLGWNGNPVGGGKLPARVAYLGEEYPPIWLGTQVQEELTLGPIPFPDAHALRGALEDWGSDATLLTAATANLNRLQAVQVALAGMALRRTHLLLLDNPTASLPVADADRLRRRLGAWLRDHGALAIVACNRPQDWADCASQFWSSTDAGYLPRAERTDG